MKKLTLIAILISIAHIINAQEQMDKNKFILGGSINLHIQNNTYPLSSLSINSGIGGIFSNSTTDVKNTNFSFLPYFGKEINPQLTLAFQVDYRVGIYKANNTSVFGQSDPVNFERNSNQIGIGIFTRHTLNPYKQFSFYIQPYFEYNILNEEESLDSNIAQQEKASYLELGLGVGLLYNINDRMRVILRTGALNYVNGNWEILDTDTEKKFSSFGANINLSTIFLGFEIKV